MREEDGWESWKWGTYSYSLAHGHKNNKDGRFVTASTRSIIGCLGPTHKAVIWNNVFFQGLNNLWNIRHFGIGQFNWAFAWHCWLHSFYHLIGRLHDKNMFWARWTAVFSPIRFPPLIECIEYPARESHSVRTNSRLSRLTLLGIHCTE